MTSIENETTSATAAESAAPAATATKTATRTPAEPKVAAKPARKTKQDTPAAAAKPASTTKKPAVSSEKKAASATKTAAKPVAAKSVESKAEKAKKPKMVRDSFTIPKPEYDVLDVLKLRAAKLGSPVKKTELIRAGIKAIAALSDAAFQQTLQAVPSLKTGRPAKAKKA